MSEYWFPEEGRFDRTESIDSKNLTKKGAEMKSALLALGISLTAGSTFANSLTEDVDVDPQACPFEAADYVMPNVTVTPWVQVKVDTQDEFAVEAIDNGLRLTHTGSALAVRIPSMVSVFSSIEVELKPDAAYCFDSLVGNISVSSNGSTTVVHSAVGSVTID